MGVISVTKGPRTAQESLDTFERVYRQDFYVQCDSMDDGPAVAMSTLLVPQLGTGYESGNDIDVFCVVRSRSITETEATTYGARYTITVEWSNKTSQQPNQDQNGNDNPLDRPYVYSMKFEKEQVPATKDINGNPVVNKANDPFVPPIMVTRSRPVITITRNEADLNIGGAQSVVDYIGKSSETVLGIQGDRVYCRDVSAQQQIENGFKFWQKTYEMVIASSGWDFHVENRGLYELPGGVSTNKRRITCPGDNYPTGTPQFLKSDGSYASTPSDSTALAFKLIKSVSLASLGLG